MLCGAKGIETVLQHLVNYFSFENLLNSLSRLKGHFILWIIRKIIRNDNYEINRNICQLLNCFLIDFTDVLVMI